MLKRSKGLEQRDKKQLQVRAFEKIRKAKKDQRRRKSSSNTPLQAKIPNQLKYSLVLVHHYSSLL